MIVREKLLMGEEQPPETRKTTIGPEDASGMPIRQKIAFKLGNHSGMATLPTM